MSRVLTLNSEVGAGAVLDNTITRTDPQWAFEYIGSNLSTLRSFNNTILKDNANWSRVYFSWDNNNEKLTYRDNGTYYYFTWTRTPITNDNLEHTYEIINDGTTLRAYIDGVEADESIAVAGSLYFSDFTQIGDTTGKNRFDIASIKYWSDATKTNLVHNYDASILDGTNTVLVDSESSNNATINGDAVFTVSAVAPAASAGSDQTNVAQGSTVTLDASASTDDVSISSYLWAQVSGTPVTLSSTSVAQPTFTAPSNSETLTFSVTVTDSDGLTSSDAVQIQIAAAVPTNIAPTSSAGSDQNDIPQGSTVTLNGSSSSDADGTISTYLWTQVSGVTVTLSDQNAVSPTFTAPTSDGSLVFSLVVTDDDGQSSTADTVTINVLGTVALPTANAGVDSFVLSGGVYKLTAEGSLTSDGDTADNLDGFLWDQVSGESVTFNDPTLARPTFTAPTVTQDTDLVFSLIVTDSAGNSAPDLTTVTVRSESAAPNAQAGNDVNGAVSGNSLTLSATSSSSPTGISAYKWRQISGAYAPLDDFTIAEPSFTVPQASNKNAFSQDLFGALSPSTVDNIRLPASLSKLVDVSYAGAFRVDHQDQSGENSSSAVGVIGYNATNNSIYLAGRTIHMAEFAVPSNLSPTETNLLSLPNATVLQSYFAPLSLNTAGNETSRINGFMTYNGQLLATSEIWYDGGDINYDNVQVFSDADDLEFGGNKGLLQFDDGAKVAGWMQPIPANLQTKLGGAYLLGWASNYSINSRYSVGPASLSVFDPQDVVDADINGTRNIPTSPIMQYSLENPITPDFQAQGTLADPLWGLMSQSKGAFLIPNTNYYLALGFHGGSNSGIGYKSFLDDGSTTPGYDVFGSGDTSNYFWIFDVDDMLTASNVYDPRPFAFGRWSHPFDNVNEFSCIGSTYDYTNERLFIVLGEAGQTGQYDKNPLILVYNFASKSQEVTEVGADASDLVFELEVTDAQGLKSTDTVTVSMGSVPVANTAPTVTVTANKATYEAGETITFTATASDPESDTLSYSWSSGETSPSITVTAPTSSSASTVTRICTVSDGSLSDSDSLTVNVNAEVDASAPVITISPNQTTYNITEGDSFTPPVGTSTDGVDGVQTITPTGTVDTNTPGTYTLTYADSDAAGNISTPVVVTVNVADGTAPVITIDPPQTSYTIEVGDSFTPPVGTSTDAVDGAQVITPAGAVDTSTIGEYTLTYSDSDAAGNAATPIVVTVNVVAAINNELVDSLSRAEFALEGTSRYTSMAGRANQSIFMFKVTNASDDINLTQEGYFDWVNNSIAKVEVIAGDSVISSDANAVIFADGYMYAELGGLQGEGQQSLEVVIYAVGDTKGIAIAGAGLPASPIITML